MASTRRRVSADTEIPDGASLRIRDTVLCATPAAAATSFIVTARCVSNGAEPELRLRAVTCAASSLSPTEHSRQAAGWFAADLDTDARPGALAAAGPKSVQDDGQEQHDADNHRLVVGIDVHSHEAVSERDEQCRARDHPDDPSLAADQAHPPDDS